jgi:dTDP-4-amino-4,6-dideoxygalactose transaminase
MTLWLNEKKIFDFYTHAFSNDKRFICPIYETKDIKSSYHVYLLRINNCTEEQRDEIIRRITSKGVAVNVHFQPLPLLSFYKNLGYKISDFPTAYKNYSCEISLPVFYDLTDEMMETVVNAVKESV